MNRLEDEDGVDGPFNRAMDRATRAPRPPRRKLPPGWVTERAARLVLEEMRAALRDTYAAELKHARDRSDHDTRREAVIGAFHQLLGGLSVMARVPSEALEFDFLIGTVALPEEHPMITMTHEERTIWYATYAAAFAGRAFKSSNTVADAIHIADAAVIAFRARREVDHDLGIAVGDKARS